MNKSYDIAYLSSHIAIALNHIDRVLKSWGLQVGFGMVVIASAIN